MRLPQRAFAAAAAVAVLVCAFAVVQFTLPSPARASGNQVSMLLDDDQLIYTSNQHMVQTLQTLHSLGVDVVKVSVVWSLLAPDATSSQRPPGFDATNPADYSPGSWARWDTLVEAAHALGMKVYFLVIGPAPTWAVPPQNRTTEGPYLGWMPNPTEYQQFVQAIATRYSGSYVDPYAPAQTATTLGSPLVPSVGATAADVTQPIPRVDYWGIWNEPDERSWLNPWYRSLPHHRKELLQPSEYRQLVGAAYNALTATGHAGDTIMVGETANRGIWSPEPFIRALYCVGSNLRPLRGTAATLVGCPTSGSRSQFAASNPGLFKTAFAHHPYAFPFQEPPNKPYPYSSFVTLYNIPAFERMLNGIMGTYGRRRPGGVPLYLTEWGYKTNPPNPYVNTSPAAQATYLNQGEYMTWQEPYVHGLTQFLLVDSPPKQGTRKGSVLYWSSFQTGLEFINGNPKPSFNAFRVPIWLPNPRRGRHVTVWGQLRAADHTTAQHGLIEFRRKGSRSWHGVRYVVTSSPEGYLVAHVSIPAAGLVRLGWLSPDGNVYYSRSVTVS